MKKSIKLLILSLIFSTQGWAGILKLDDCEKLNSDYSRIFNNLSNFYQINQQSIKILREKNFFQEGLKADPSACSSALQAIKLDSQSVISQNYKKTRKGLIELKKDLEETETYISEHVSEDVKNTLNYLRGILLIVENLSRL